MKAGNKDYGFEMKFLLSVLVVLIIATGGLANAESTYEFSDYEFSHNSQLPEKTLEITMDDQISLRSYTNLTRVGGINFSSIYNENGADIYSITYDPGRPDGKRVAIESESGTYSVPLYDWELKPISNFSESPYTAVVSIFGDGPETQEFRYIEFHKAFKDTHLGMRLLQADILLMDPFVFSEAPTFGGRKLYLPGEARELPMMDRFGANVAAFSMLSDFYFQAWVITDIGLQPRISLSDGVASADVGPYHYFWRADLEFRRRDLERYEELRNRGLSLSEEYDKLFAIYRDARPGSTEEISSAKAITELEEAILPIFEELEALDKSLESYEPTVEEVTELTGLFRDRAPGSELILEIAPFVFDAYRKVAAYSALFRAVKRDNPKSWFEFLDRVNNSVQLEPVLTPTQFRWRQ